MLSLPELFKKAEQTRIDRNWEVFYVLVDIHDTIIKSDYKSDGRTVEYFTDAIEVLTRLSNIEHINLILWSSCNEDTAKWYLEEFKKQGIIFNDFNINTEVQNTPYACFDKKLYFNIIIDDKAGFEADKDWTSLKNYLDENKSN